MPTRPLGRCTWPNCPNDQQPNNRRCPKHARESEAARGTAAARGYNSKGHRRFRKTVLRRDPFCTCDREDHAWHMPGHCTHVSNVADHFPKSRRELLAEGADPNDPRSGRGICARCHNAETARLQPGGFNAR